MKITKLIGASALIAGMALTAVLPAHAEDRDDHGHRNMSINARQHRQHQRIEQGERSGQLTDREEDRLEHREGHIRRQERRDRRDGGKFTARERAHIQHELNQTSRSIHHQKHDRQHQR